MLGKALNFLVSVVGNGVIVFFCAIPVWILANLAFLFLSAPVSFLYEPVKGYLMTTGEFMTSYAFIFSVMLISEVLNDCGLPNLRSIFKNLRKLFRREQCPRTISKIG